VYDSYDVVLSIFVIIHCQTNWGTRGTGISGLRRGMATLPQDNQELLVVRDKVGRPPGELGVSKSMECDIFPSVFWHCWFGDRKGIRPVKKLGVGLLVVVIWLELCMTYSSRGPVVTTTSIILCFNKYRLTQVHLENDWQVSASLLQGQRRLENPQVSLGWADSWNLILFQYSDTIGWVTGRASSL